MDGQHGVRSSGRLAAHESGLLLGGLGLLGGALLVLGLASLRLILFSLRAGGGLVLLLL